MASTSESSRSWTGRIVACLIALVVASGCGSPSTDVDASSPQSILVGAANSTLAAPSFRELVRLESSESPKQSGVAWYVAPDKARVRGLAAGGELIVVGETAYLSAPGSQGRYWKSSNPNALEDSGVLLPVEAAKSGSNVRQDGQGSTYLFESPFPNGRGTFDGRATIENGLLTSVILTYNANGTSATQSYAFDSFGDPFEIQQPPSSAIVSGQPPSMP